MTSPLAIADMLRARSTSSPSADRPLLVALADSLSTGDPSHLLTIVQSNGSISASFRRLDAVRRQATTLLADHPDAAGPIADIVAQAQEKLILEEETLLRREHMLNQRLEQSFLTSPLATLEANEHGIITRWNPAAERIFGWSAAEAIGKNAIELLVPNIAREQVEEVVSALLSETRQRIVAMPILRKMAGLLSVSGTTLSCTTLTDESPVGFRKPRILPNKFVPKRRYAKVSSVLRGS